jgi:hypothetical protein
VQAADQGAEVMARAVIGGGRGRNEEPSFEVKSVVAAARLDREQIDTFCAAQLLILSDDLAHVAISVKSSLLLHLYAPLLFMSMSCFHVSLFLPQQLAHARREFLFCCFCAFFQQSLRHHRKQKTALSRNAPHLA